MSTPGQPSPVSAEPIDEVELDDLIDAARALITQRHRRILGIVGGPGSGKSTLAAALATALGRDAVLVGLDGFHLANSELHRLGRHDRKGAADTFDAAGYVNLLRRLRARDGTTVYAPLFDRSLEESIGCAVPVPSDVPLIITEGNYLLADGPDWGPIRGLLDECWYVEPGEDVRLARLIARHESFGRSAEEASSRAHGSDRNNAELIAATRHRANRIIRVVYQRFD